VSNVFSSKYSRYKSYIDSSRLHPVLLGMWATPKGELLSPNKHSDKVLDRELN